LLQLAQVDLLDVGVVPHLLWRAGREDAALMQDDVVDVEIDGNADEEHTEGICGLGTGFIDPLGRAVALSISVPATRFERLRSDLAAKLLAAREWTTRVLNIPVTVDEIESRASRHCH